MPVLKLRHALVYGVLTLVITLFTVSYWLLYAEFKRPMLSKKQGAATVLILDKSTSAIQFANVLKEKRWINRPRAFVLLIRLRGWASQLKAGVYQIQPGESALSLLGRVIAGDVIKQHFTIIAGTKQDIIDKALRQAAYLHYASDAWTFIKTNHLNAEGMLLADTYEYAAGSSSKVLLEQANAHLMRYLESSWSKRAPGLPYRSPYELLIAASIIEKESALDKERRLIAGVLINRIRQGMPLQMDPTVIYGLHLDYGVALTHKDLLIDSPYNSYMHRGLPPTPIAMVGKEAIEAAAHPEVTSYLYFVAKGDGTHQFSTTYIEQKKAIQHYLRSGSQLRKTPLSPEQQLLVIRDNPPCFSDLNRNTCDLNHKGRIERGNCISSLALRLHA